MFQVYLKTLIIMTVLIAFTVPGFLLRKLKLLNEKSSSTISNILLYVCQPALAIDAFCVYSQEDWQVIQNISKVVLFGNFGIIIAISMLSMLIIFLICKLVFLKSKEKNTSNIYTFIAIFSNCGFLGVPFVKMFTGSNPLAVMYIMVFNIIFIITSWTLGVTLITGNIHEIRLKKIICNPSIIAVVIAIIMFFIPQINIFMIDGVKDLQIFPQYLSYMNAPLSMMIVGIRLAELSPTQIFCKIGVYISGFLRLIIAPLITFSVALIFYLILKNTKGSLSIGEEYIILSPVIAMAMSPAASVVAMAERFNGDKDTATAAFVTNTLLSIITIPIIISIVMLSWNAII